MKRSLILILMMSVLVQNMVVAADSEAISEKILALAGTKPQRSYVAPQGVGKRSQQEPSLIQKWTYRYPNVALGVLFAAGISAVVGVVGLGSIVYCGTDTECRNAVCDEMLVSIKLAPVGGLLYGAGMKATSVLMDTWYERKRKNK